MADTVGIVGAGVLGRVMALQLKWDGWDVTLFDRNPADALDSCSWTGAGMIAPYCELEAAERMITDYGVLSMARWPEIVARLAAPVFYESRGSLVVSHPNDRQELERLRRRVIDNAPRPDIMRELHGRELADIEPELAGRFSHGLYFPFEQHMDNRELLRAMGRTLDELGVARRNNFTADTISPHRIAEASFDWVIDCRGMGARNDLPDLRGVRGELLYLHAPDVNLSRPVRLMHPRFSIYIVPRAHSVYVVGATAIESEDHQAITVQSALELLSAAYTVHTGFAEGRLVETSVSCRPAFPDNQPRIYAGDGLLRINGLYRHGFLISPILSEFAFEFMEHGRINNQAKNIFRAL